MIFPSTWLGYMQLSRFIVFLIVIYSHSALSATQSKACESSCKTQVVANQTRTSPLASHPEIASLDPWYFEQTPQLRSSLHQQDQEKDHGDEHGSKSTTLEVQDLLALDQSQAAVLSQLRRLVGRCERHDLPKETSSSTTRLAVERMGGNNSQAKECSKEKQFHPVQRTGKREGQRQGQGEAQGGITAITLRDYAPSGSSSSTFRTKQSSSGTSRPRSIWFQRIVECYQTCFPRRSEHADRNQRSTGAFGRTSLQAVDFGIAQSDFVHGQGAAYIEGTHGCERKTSTPMASTLGRISQVLETTIGQLRCQTVRIRRLHHQSKERHGSLSRDDSNLERSCCGQACACTSRDLSPSRYRGGPESHSRSRRKSATQKPTRSSCRMRYQDGSQGGRDKDQGQQVGTCDVLRRRRSSRRERTSEEAEIQITGKLQRTRCRFLLLAATICSQGCHFNSGSGIVSSQRYSYDDIVNNGSALACHKKAKRGPSHGRRVRFDVPAYVGDFSRCAANYHNPPAVPLHHPAQAEWHSITMAYDYVDPFAAHRRAIDLHFECIDCNAQTILDAQCPRLPPHVLDLWCAEDNDIGDNKPSDTPEEDLAGHHPLVHLEWQALRPTPASSCQPETPVARNDAVMVALSPWCSSGASLTLRTYGYFGRDAGQRDVQLPCDDLPHWKDFVDVAWYDFVRPGGCKVTILQPQPDDPGIHLQLIVTMDGTDEVLILLETSVDSLPSTRTVVECHLPMTGYAIVSKMDQPIHFDMNYHFWQHGAHHYGSEILPTANGQFWIISILSPTGALHLQQKSASRISKRPSVWRTWPEPNEDLVRILQDTEEDDFVPPPPNRGPLTFHDENEWIRLAIDREQFEDTHIDLTVHGLYETDVGMRRAHTPTLSLVAVESALQGLWPHLDHLAKKVHIVQPQPSHTTSSNFFVILEFYDIWNPREFAPPVLHECLQLEMDTISRTAWYSNQFTTKEDFPLDREHCPIENEEEAINLHVWLRGKPLFPYQTYAVQAGDLVTIRAIKTADAIEDWVQRFFPDAIDFKQQLIAATAFDEVSVSTWTFIGATPPGSPACIDRYQPAWLRFPDPYFIVQTFLEIATIRNFDYRGQAIHAVRPIQGRNMTFLYGPVLPNHSLVHTVYSAKWDNDWVEQFCYQVPSTLNLRDFVRSVRLEEDTLAVLHNKRLVQDESLHICNGDSLEIEIEGQSDEDSDNGTFNGPGDSLSLMQSPSTSTPHSGDVTLTLRGTHGLLHTVQISVDQSLYAYLDEHWPFPSHQPTDLAALHAVSAPPSYVRPDSEQIFLVELSSDRFDQVHPDDVLLLLTVRYFVSGAAWTSDKVKTRVLWGPKKATREQVLQFLRMQWHCRSEVTTCELLFNEVVWAIHDTALYNFESGDHLRLNIKSMRDNWCEVTFSEQADRERRVLESSPSSPPIEQERPESEEADLSPYTIQNQPRSRSRSSSLLQRTTQIVPANSRATGAPFLQCRPNADINDMMDFDDYIPYDRQFPNGDHFSGRVVAPFQWSDHPFFRAASDHGAVHRDPHHHLYVNCRTWFVTHTGPAVHQYRDLTIRAQLLIHIAERVRHLWQDLLSPADVLRVYLVTPTPAVSRHDGPRVHILAECNRPADSDVRPILMSFQQISVTGLAEHLLWRPLLSPPALTLDFLQQAAFTGCLSHHFLVPIAARARGWLQQGQQRHTTPGAYIPAWYDLRRPDTANLAHAPPIDDDDATQLMQMNAQSRSGKVKDAPQESAGPHVDDLWCGQQSLVVCPSQQDDDPNSEKRGEEDSDSLLQPSATPSTAPHQGVSGAAGGSLQPHVSDRWCAVDLPPAVGRITLSLESLLSAQQTIVELTGPQCSPPFPNQLEMTIPVTTETIAQELRSWGHECTIHGTEDPHTFFCVSHSLLKGGDAFVYIGHEDPHHSFGRFLTNNTLLDEMDHMRYLATLGITRAAILQTLQIAPGIAAIYFDVGAQGQLSSKDKEPGQPPPRQPSTTRRSYQPNFGDHRPAATLTLPLPMDEIHKLFGSGSNVLVTSLEGIDIPRVCSEALTQCQPQLTFDDIDRLLIYVDGSSDPKHRHHHPTWVEEEGTEDTWAFVVLGERYIDEDCSQTVFFGWSAQCVVHDSTAKCFAGAPRIGSDVAELEALFWAGLWRLSLGHNIPTRFCFDSIYAGHFAGGICGSTSPSTLHRNLRGVFQSLYLGLEPGSLLLHHVPGHCGMAWNELADCLAKHRSHHVRFDPRQDLDLNVWKDLLPHLRMLFNAGKLGLPTLTTHGFDVEPPALPGHDVTGDQLMSNIHCRGEYQTGQCDVTLSLLSVNVQSLQRAIHGRGRSALIQAQAEALCLNCVALQETRGKDSFFVQDHFICIGTASSEGQGGIQFWVSTEQPIAWNKNKPLYVCKQDIVILHRGCRRLLLRIQHDAVDLHFAVLHAPHSGRPNEERIDWWERTTTLIRQECSGAPVIALGDFNAQSGRRDMVHVFEADDTCSSNTELMRTFLSDLQLCLPSTGDLHTGSHNTWVSPDGTIEKRLDYIAVPCDLLYAVSWSQVVEDFDLGQSNDDHKAVSLQLTWRQHCTYRKKKGKSACFDRSSITKETLRDGLQQIRAGDWKDDIETQVDSFTSDLVTQLTKSCPRKPEMPKKPYITEEMWALRGEKNSLRKRLHATQRALRQEWLQLFFSAWRTGFGTDPGYARLLTCCRVRLGAHYYSCSQSLHKQLKEKKASYVKEILEDIPPSASASQILYCLRPCIGTSNMRKRKGTGLPFLKDAHGETCRTTTALVDRWADFFGAMEGGTRCNLQQQRERWLDGLKAHSQPTHCSELAHLPSLFDLEQAYRRVQKGKAVGQDQVPPEVCSACPTEIAALTYSQLVKAYCHGQESLLHKGGKLIPAYKRGPRNECASYRSLLISSHVGKTIHRSLRQHQCSFYEGFMHSQQWGGRRAFPVNFANHLCRAFQRATLKEGRSCALLFLDLTEAYYRILRPLAVGGGWTDSTIAAMTNRLGMPPEVVQELYAHLCDPDALTMADLPATHRNYIQAIHQDTYFYVEGQHDVVRTELGTRPGDSFADVIFGYLWSRVLNKLQLHLTDMGVLEEVDCYRGIGTPRAEDAVERKFVLGPTWCDDLCIMISGDTGQEAISRCTTAASVLLDICRSFAMTPNLKKGKTEILLCLRGHKSKDLRRRFFDPTIGGHLTVVCEHDTVKIAVTGAYTHLGGVIHHKGDQRKEAARRLAMCHEAYAQHRRIVFKNDHFTLQRRAELFRSLVLSKFSFGAESWIIPTQNARHQIHAGIIRLYKRLLGSKPDTHYTDDEILTALHLPAPTELMRAARLRYLGLLYRSGPPDLWGMIRRDGEWMELIWSDLDWMHAQLWNSSELLDPRCHWEQWEHLIQAFPGYWKRLVGRASQHAILQQRQRRQEVSQGHATIIARLQPEENREEETVETSQEYGCMYCKIACKSKAGEGAHMFRKHGHVNPVRHVAGGTSCDVCLKCFHTTVKLCDHLKYSKACYRALLGRGDVLSPAPGRGSTQQHRADVQHDGLLPSQLVHGPRKETECPRDPLDHDPHLYTSIGEAIIDSGTMAELCDGIRAAVHARPISWTATYSTFQSFLRQLNPVDLEDSAFEVSDIREVLQMLSKSEAWDFLDRGTLRKKPAIPNDLCHWECILNQWYQEDYRPKPPAPRAFGCHRYILHAFSGRRRIGDFEFFVERLPVRSGIIIHTLSVDIVVNSKWGNLRCPTTCRFWLDGIVKGFILAFLGGPPCETWSRARNKALKTRHGERKQRGPRPLREVGYLWGLDCLGLRETMQLIFGNGLLLFSLEAAVTLYLTGGACLVEHPSCPEEPTAASIWRLPLVQFLLTLPGFELISLAQGFFGAASAKPTQLLALRLTEMTRILDESRVSESLPQRGSIGLDEQGGFQTTKLKEYGPSLCKAFARALGKSVQDLPLDCEIEICKNFADTATLLEQTDFSDRMGADFMG